MTEYANIKRCEGCNAPIKPGDERCWYCGTWLYWNRDIRMLWPCVGDEIIATTTSRTFVPPDQLILSAYGVMMNREDLHR